MISSQLHCCNTLALYGELGRFPLYIERNIRMVKYFIKINTIKSDNCILNAVLNDQIYSVYRDCNTNNWASNVRDRDVDNGAAGAATVAPIIWLVLVLQK